MAVVIDEVQVEAVEAQGQSRDAPGHAQKPGGQSKIDRTELAVNLRLRHQRQARLWAD